MTAQLQIDAVRRLVDALPNEALGGARDAALANLERNGLPTTRHEDWKYTDLTPVIDLSNAWASGGGQRTSIADDVITRTTADLPADWLVIRNGLVDMKSVAALQRPGVRVRLLSEKALLSDLNIPLSSLNTALLSDGLAIDISADCDEHLPIGLLHIDSAEQKVSSSHTRISIALDSNCTASFLEYHTSAGEAAHYANNIIDITVGTGARANIVRYQNRGGLHSQTAFLRATLGKQSQFHHAAFDLGGQLVRNDLDIQIIGADASTSFCGLYLANERQHIDNHTRVDHRVGPAHSAQEYRGIIADHARCVWNGKAVVHDGADGTDANQANHNLLLSERAEINAKPELEIYADDVKCSHGTTVGQLDESALFYLQTRGIDAATARQLLTRAFAQAIVDMSPIGAFHDFIANRVAEKLAALDAGESQ